MNASGVVAPLAARKATLASRTPAATPHCVMLPYSPRLASGAFSVASRVAPPTTAVYTATKGAVDAVTHVLAKELGPKKIRVNSINPGMVETEGTHATGVIGSDFQKQFEAQTPLGRIAQPEDIASIAVFLASADSGWLTGETLLASGGLR